MKTTKRIILLLIVLLFIIIVWQLYFLYKAYSTAQNIRQTSQDFKLQVKSQNYNQAKTSLAQVNQNLNELNQQVKQLVVIGYIPPFNKFKSDLNDTNTFLGNQSNTINNTLSLLSKSPSFNNLSQPDRQIIIENISTIAVASKPLVNDLEDMGVKDQSKFEAYRQLLAQLPFLLGTQKPAQYALLFQNNTELRPTGGFWGAYGQLTLESGLQSSVSSGPLSDLVLKPNSNQAPKDIESIVNSITGEPPSAYFINSVSDFAQPAKSVSQAMEQKIGQAPIGVVAVNIPAIKALLKITGPIEVKDFGQINANNIEQSLVYELNIQNPDPKLYDEHKTILGEIGSDLVTKAYAKNPAKLISWLAKQSQGKNILLYSENKDVQAAAEKLEVDGSFNKTGNFIHLEELNFGGKQSSFISRSVKVEKTGDNSYKAIINYNYKNNVEAGKLKYPAAKLLVRLRLPSNTELIGSTGGLQSPASRFNLLNTTAISNVIFLNPGDSKSLTFEYKLSDNLVDNNKVPVWSFQPGLNNTQIIK